MGLEKSVVGWVLEGTGASERRTARVPAERRCNQGVSNRERCFEDWGKLSLVRVVWSESGERGARIEGPEAIHVPSVCCSREVCKLEVVSFISSSFQNFRRIVRTDMDVT